MLNFVPKTAPSVSLLYGKRPLQRVVVGSSEQHVEIPLKVTDEVTSKLDTQTEYVCQKYNALPWKDFMDIKVDAANLIDSNVKSALTDLDWYPKVNALVTGEKQLVEAGLGAKLAAAAKAVKLPIAK